MSLPSLFEGSSLAAAEAMAQGMPLVVTPNTGSFARDGVDGHIVPIRDAEAIAEALERLRDEPARQAMGESAAARAREFTWHRYRQKLVQHVDEWLDQRGN
jgi:glycosyltransferase involved in cell wall biosynthesis